MSFINPETSIPTIKQIKPYLQVFEQSSPLYGVSEIDKILKHLETYYAHKFECRRHINEILNSDLPPDHKEEYKSLFEQQIQLTEKNKQQLLEKLMRLPPQFAKHAQRLQEFHTVGGYEKSVFIMTKYPEGNSSQDKALRNIINAVKKAVKKMGFIPRIGSDKAYYEGVWENVELYLCGCKYGIAIVESKYGNELNPNVAMEWGWMRAMNKKVLYLVENEFDKVRADLSGLIKSPFAWNKPEKGINKAIKEFLQSVRSPLKQGV